MPVYNREEYLSEAIDSILAQSFRDFEMVIADDGSKDDTLRIAAAYAKQDKRIKVLALPYRGVIAARNAAIKNTNKKSKYLLNHDSDDISLPLKLEKLVSYLERNKDISIVGCFAEYFNEKGEFKGFFITECFYDDIRGLFSTMNPFVHSATLIRRKVFDRIGVYRKNYSLVEDYDLFSRALAADFKMANIPEILHRIRLHSSAMSRINKKRIAKLSRGIQNRPKGIR